MARLAELEFDDLLGRIEGRDIVEAERQHGHPDELAFGDARAFSLFLEIMPAGHEEGLLRDEPDQLAPRHPDAQLRGQPRRFVEDAVGRGDLVVREIDGDLGPAVVLDVPAHGLDLLELSRHLDRPALGVLDEVAVPVPLGPAAFAQAQGDLLGELPVPGVEVDVIGDEEFPGADDRRPGPGVEDGLAVIGRPGRVLELFGKPFVFTRPDGGQVPPLGLAGGRFIKVDGDAELAGHPRPERLGQADAVFHGHARDGHEGANVRGPDAAVGALVRPHVDDLGGLGDGAEGRFRGGFGGADERDHGPIGRGAGVDVQQLDLTDGLDLADDGPDLLLVAALAEIGDAFDELHFSTPLCSVSLKAPVLS